MIILGLSGSTHDCSSAIIKDGKIICAIEEERLSRKKHAPYSLPILSAREVIRQAELKPQDIEKVAYFLDPSTFNKKVLNHIILGDPKRYLLNALAYRTYKFYNRGKKYEDELLRTLNTIGVMAPIEFVKHHLAHIAGAFYLSPLKESMIISLDNMGELDSTLLAYGKGSMIKEISSQNIPHSLGMLYATITDYLGFKAWSEEGKVMALAAYGNPTIPLQKIVALKNGKFKIKTEFQMIQTRKKNRLYSKKLIKLLGEPRKKNEQITQHHQNIAASIQFATEEVAKYIVSWLYKITKSKNLCLAGGVALNCKMNGELLKLPFIDNLYVSPAPGDSGASLGAAIYCSVINSKVRPRPLLNTNIGRGYSNKEILKALKSSNLSYKKITDPDKVAAELLLKEKIIVWFQGKTEFGPRALGYRSILALPQKKSIKDFINIEVKHREQWRPLCPSILAEQSYKYFENSSFGRFMNVAVHSKELARSNVPSVIHIDGTSRIQKVYENENPLYYNLLKIIGYKTGDPILLNTSFNLKEPIVNSPKDAIRTFKKMPITSMIIGNYVVQ
jgi:carbamoyltransferase